MYVLIFQGTGREIALTLPRTSLALSPSERSWNLLVESFRSEDPGQPARVLENARRLCPADCTVSLASRWEVEEVLMLSGPHPARMRWTGRTVVVFQRGHRRVYALQGDDTDCLVAVALVEQEDLCDAVRSLTSSAVRVAFRVVPVLGLPLVKE